MKRSPYRIKALTVGPRRCKKGNSSSLNNCLTFQVTPVTLTQMSVAPRPSRSDFNPCLAPVGDTWWCSAWSQSQSQCRGVSNKVCKPWTTGRSPCSGLRWQATNQFHPGIGFVIPRHKSGGRGPRRGEGISDQSWVDGNLGTGAVTDFTLLLNMR